jgi:hypothetical protein
LTSFATLLLPALDIEASFGLMKAINIEFTLNNNLNEFVADCEKSLLESKIKEYKTLMNKNDLSELQLKKLCRDLFNFNSDMAFKIDKISKLV